MGQSGMRLILLITFSFFCSLVRAQSFSFNCTKDTSLNFCNNVQCITIKAKIPDIHAKSTNYTINPTSTVPGCFPVYIAPDNTTGTPTQLTIDDKYSTAVDIGFPFMFFDSLCSQLVVSTNGYVSFDATRATLASHYQILNNLGSLSASAGTGQDLPTTLYDKALVMGPYHDLDPSQNTSATMRVQYNVLGTAPQRRWVLSFYKVPLFQCTTKIQNTHQIVLYESTGMIEVLVFDKEICTSWNQGRAMIGIQNFTRDVGVMVPGRKASDAPWGTAGMNESYRFIPSEGPSLFKRVELYDISGTLISTGTAAAAGSGQLEASFPAVCPPLGTTSYVVRSVYKKIDDTTQEIYGMDTIRVTRTGATSLNATASMIPAACGPNGSITVAVGDGIGTAPFTFVVDGGAPVNTSSHSYTFTGLIAGSHNVVVTDAGGCSSNLTVTVTSSGVLQINTVIQPTSCQGASNGTVTVNPINGVAPWQYSIDNGGTYQLSNTFNNLTPGTYLLSVKDASGCVLTSYPVTVQSGAPLQPTWAINPPSCSGAANGSITINNPTNGQAPYQYQINGGGYGTSNVFSNLPPGTYIISVKDAQGCSINLALTVPNGTGNLTASALGTGTSCPGANNGSIVITAQSGSGPYQYSLNGGAFQPGNVASGLAAGTYTVVLKDGAGCTSQSITVTITAGTALLANAVPTNASCSGVNNGKIVVTPTNGSGPYHYQLDGGTAQTDSTFLNVSAGTHTIIVTDGAGCVTSSISVTVGVAAAVSGTSSVTATSCNGASDGQVTFTPTNGTSPYQFALDGGTFQNSPSYTGLTAATHSFVVKDAVGCTSAPINFVVGAGAVLTGTATSTPTSCTGVSNGTVTVTFNGTPQQVITLQPQYSIDGGAYQSGNIFANVSAGTHQVVIRSINGCQSAPITVTVVVGPPLTATYTATTTSCSGANNGTITVQPQATGGPFQYSLNGGVYQSSPTFTGLAAGSYTIVMKDALGCSTNPIPATVPPGQPITATTSVQNVLCNGGNSGGVTLNVPSTATPPVQYSLDNVTFQTSPTFTGLTASSYTAYFKDNNGCAGSQAFTVIEPTAITSSVSLRSVSCNGQADGLIRVTASGGTSPYQYSINGTSYQSLDSFHVATGTYTVYIKDNNGCIKQLPPQTVSEPAVLTATSTATNSTCAGGNDGKITVTAAGGTAPYQYSVNGGTSQSSNQFNVLAGSYTVTVKDANGCSYTINQSVQLTNDLVVTAVPDTTICEGKGVKLYPNTNATQFLWTPSTGLSSSTIAQPIASPSATTTYTVIATLGVCNAQQNITVNVNPAPVADAGPAGDICFGQTYTLQGSGGLTYEWAPSADFITSISNNQPVVAPKQTATYSLNVVDAKGCRSLQPALVRVTVTPPIYVQVSKDTVVAYGDTFQLHAASAATDYSWSPTYGLDNPNKANPIVTVTGDVTYTVTATTSAGCMGTASVTLKVYKGPEIYVATAFTPNSDGKNDIFTPFPVGIKSYNYFRVYNRWGQLVFATSGFNQGWDGKMNGREQPSGTYVWVVEGITKDDKVISRRGTVVLIR